MFALNIAPLRPQQTENAIGTDLLNTWRWVLLCRSGRGDSRFSLVRLRTDPQTHKSFSRFGFRRVHASEGTIPSRNNSNSKAYPARDGVFACREIATRSLRLWYASATSSAVQVQTSRRVAKCQELLLLPLAFGWMPADHQEVQVECDSFYCLT